MANEKKNSTKHPIEKLRDALEECLAYAQTKVGLHESGERPVDDAQESDAELMEGLAQGQVRLAKVIESATTDEFKGAARELVNAIIAGVANGETYDVLEASKHLASVARKRRWLYFSGIFFSSVLDRRRQGLVPIERIERSAAEYMRGELAKLDQKAEELKIDEIIEIASNTKLTSIEGFAAKLARACGAFGYDGPNPGPNEDADEHRTVKRTFEEARSRGIVSIWHPVAPPKKTPAQ